MYLLPLNEFPRRTTRTLSEWIAERFERDLREVGHLADALDAGDVWLLLDGLNEMAYGEEPEDRFDDLGELLSGLPPGNRAIVTCRALDVAGVLGSAVRAEVKPLSADAVQEFLNKYVPEHAERAARDVRRHELLELYQNPYRLSLLVDALRDTGTIPANRAELFSTLVRRTLLRNLRMKDRGWLVPLLGPDAQTCVLQGRLPTAFASGESQGTLLFGLGRLAFHWQCSEPGRHRWWPKNEALSAFDPDDLERARALVRAGRKVLVIEEDVAQDRVRFAHQQLQEYFAARYWVHAAGDTSLRDHAGTAFAQAAKGERVDDPKLGTPLAEVVARLKPGTRLQERPATGWEETGVMACALAPNGAFAAHLAKADLVSAGRGALSAGDRVAPLVKEDLRRRLADYVLSPKVELRTRIDAAEALEAPEPLGYERKTSASGVVFLWPPMSPVPAGTYRIGSHDDDDQAYDDETPAHDFEVTGDIQLARFPVTNAEYKLFMDAGGYEDERWWPSGEARAWWKAERPDTQAEERARFWHELDDGQLAELATLRGWTSGQQEEARRLSRLPLDELIAYFTPQQHPATLKRPEHWLDPTYNHPCSPS